MSALDDARAVLAKPGLDPEATHIYRHIIAGLVAECESERGRIEALREVLVFYANYSGPARRAMEADDAHMKVEKA